MFSAIAAMTATATICSVIDEKAAFEKSLDGMSDDEKAALRAKRAEQMRDAQIARMRHEIAAAKDQDSIGVWAFILGLICGTSGK